MSPAPFTPEKQCYSVLFLQFFREALIQTERVLFVKGKGSGRIAGAGTLGRLGEVVAHKALERGRGIQRGRDGEKSKSAAEALF
jgi:hypothetical protein